MKRNHYSFLTGLLAAALIAGGAQAQGWGDGMAPCGAMGSGQRQGGMKFDPAQRAERHLGVMKNALKITAEQEALWNAYAEKMKGTAGKGLQALHAQARDQNLSAPERMAKMEGLMAERLAAMKDVHESFNRLYAALTPEQKTTADQFAARMGQGGPGRRGPGGSGMGPGNPGPGRAAPPQG